MCSQDEARSIISQLSDSIAALISNASLIRNRSDYEDFYICSIKLNFFKNPSNGKYICPNWKTRHVCVSQSF